MDDFNVERHPPVKRENSFDEENMECSESQSTNSTDFNKIPLYRDSDSDYTGQGIYQADNEDLDGDVNLRNDRKYLLGNNKASLVQSRVNYWHAAQSSVGDETRALSATRTIETITYNILEETLRNITYNPHVCRLYCQQLSGMIMEAIKSQGVRRYKYVAVVSVGSLKERPGMHFGSRCLWDDQRDSFATVTYTNETIFAVAYLYGLHFD